MDDAILARLSSLGLEGALLLCDSMAAKHLMFLGMDRVLALGCTQVGDLDFDPSAALLPYSHVVILRTVESTKMPRFDCPVTEVFCSDHEMAERYTNHVRPEGAAYCPLLSIIGDDMGLVQVPNSCTGFQENRDVDLLLQVASALDILEVGAPAVHCIGDHLQAFASFLHDALQVARGDRDCSPSAIVVVDRRLDLVSVSVPSTHECDPATDDWAWLRRVRSLDPVSAEPEANALFNVPRVRSGPVEGLWQSLGRKTTPNALRNVDFSNFNDNDANLKHAMALIVACAASVPENSLMREVALPINVPYPPLVESLTNKIRDEFPFKGTLDSFIAPALMGDSRLMHTVSSSLVASIFGVFGKTQNLDPLKASRTVVFLIFGGVTLTEVNQFRKVRDQLADSRRIVLLATEFARPDAVANEIFSDVW